MEQKKKRGIKALIFDIGSVLRLNKGRTPKVHSFVADKLDVSLDQYFDAIDSAYAKSIEGKISEEKTLELMAKNLIAAVC